MANIDNELAIIKESPKGEDVREAIIRAISKIYNDREYPASTKKFTYNTGPEGETGGPWNRVIVDVDGGKTLEVDGINEPIHDNGYYTIDTLKQLGYIPNPNCDAVNGFSVQVDRVPGNFGVKNITENGEYDPLLDGFDGYSKVYVNVLGGDKKSQYTVKFYDGTALLASVVVPYGANAVYPSDKALPSSGGIFTGWNPNPINVSRDMDCRAVYAVNGVTGMGELQETIGDTWQTIITKVRAGNRPYPVGSTKLIRVMGKTPEGANKEYILNMMLIGYNLDINRNNKYAASTWININRTGNMPLIALNSILTSFTLTSNDHRNVTAEQQYANCHGEQIWWKNSLIRALLNGNKKDIAYDTYPGGDDLSYYNAMAAQQLLWPTLINTAVGFNMFDQIEEVVKYSFYGKIDMNGNRFNLKDQVTWDKLWIPSLRELAYPIYNGAALPAQFCTAGPSYGNPNIYGQWQYNTSKDPDAGYAMPSGFYSRDNSPLAHTSSAPAIRIMRTLGDGDSGGQYITKIMDTGYQQTVQANNYYYPISFCL